MFIEMTCGCMAAFQADAEDADTLLLTWANSFVEAHRACGYMNQLNTDSPEKTKHYDINPSLKRKEKDE
jgi:hypothetical protein